MKIATFNVNGVNGRLPVLIRWLAEAKPDIACLQELKAQDEKFPERAFRAAGYRAVWYGQKSWNGVAILARDRAPIETRRGLPGELLATGMPVVLAGDFNVMPTELDVYKPERWVDDALFRPEVRTAFHCLIAQGWTDALRALHPGERIYTFWDYYRNAWPRNAGLRIDHLLLSPSVADRLVAADVDRLVRGWEKASDHAPAWIELGSAGKSIVPRRGGPTTGSGRDGG